jgi:hypothetical protein
MLKSYLRGETLLIHNPFSFIEAKCEELRKLAPLDPQWKKEKRALILNRRNNARNTN